MQKQQVKNKLPMKNSSKHVSARLEEPENYVPMDKINIAMSVEMIQGLREAAKVNMIPSVSELIRSICAGYLQNERINKVSG